MDLRWTTQQIYGPKIAFLKLMDLSGTFLQVDGPPILKFRDEILNRKIRLSFAAEISSSHVDW
jgi:hypothetical protein